MPLRRRAASLAVGLALVLGPGALAAETMRFDISIAGIPAGELTLDAREDGGTYAAGSRIRATGLIGAVARLRYDGEANGRITASGALEPERYAARSRSTRSERDTEILYERGTPVSVRVEPPRSSQPDPAAQTGAIDPVTAGVALLRDGDPERVCNRRLALFDGSRRSQIVVGRAEARGGELVCNGSYSRVEGEAHSVSGETEWPFRLVFRQNGNGLAEIRRIETRTRFGTAVIERRG